MDLLIDDGEKIIPIEVRAEENFRVKSLKMYREKYDPAVCVSLKISKMAGSRKIDLRRRSQAQILYTQ